jgi:hypothetical protein
VRAIKYDAIASTRPPIAAAPAVAQDSRRSRIRVFQTGGWIQQLAGDARCAAPRRPPMDTGYAAGAQRMTDAGLCLVNRHGNTRYRRGSDRQGHGTQNCTGRYRYADKSGLLV